MAEINRFLNGITPYKLYLFGDMEQYGHRHYWYTPEEMFHDLSKKYRDRLANRLSLAEQEACRAFVQEYAQVYPVIGLGKDSLEVNGYFFITKRELKVLLGTSVGHKQAVETECSLYLEEYRDILHKVLGGKAA